jgi:hypothetical protein
MALLFGEKTVVLQTGINWEAFVESVAANGDINWPDTIETVADSSIVVVTTSEEIKEEVKVAEEVTTQTTSVPEDSKRSLVQPLLEEIKAEVIEGLELSAKEEQLKRAQMMKQLRSLQKIFKK